MPINADAEVAKQNAAIQQVYGNLQGNLQQAVGATGNTFDQAGQEMGAAYGQGMGDLQSIANSLEARIGRSADALGLELARPQALLGLQGTLAANLASMANNRTTDLGALAQQGAAYKGIAQRAVGDAGMQGAQQETSLATKLRNAVLGYNADEEKARSDVEIQKLANQSDLAKIQGDLQRQGLENQMALREQQARLLESQMGDPLDALRAEKLALEVEAMRNGGNEESRTKYGKGEIGLREFMQDYGVAEDSPEYRMASFILNQAPLASAELMRQDKNISIPEVAEIMLSGQNPSTGATLDLSGIDPSLLNALVQIYYGDTQLGGWGG